MLEIVRRRWHGYTGGRRKWCKLQNRRLVEPAWDFAGGGGGCLICGPSISYVVFHPLLKREEDSAFSWWEVRHPEGRLGRTEDQRHTLHD